MASPPLNEIFSNVTMFIDLTTYEDNRKVIDLVKKMPFEMVNKTCFAVNGSFQQVEELFYNISSFPRSDSAGARVQAQYNLDRISLAEVGPVEVSEEVMRYIQQKYSKDLQRITGRDVYTDVEKNQDKVFIFFQPLHQMSDCLKAKENFVTLLQNIKVNFRVRTYSVELTDRYSLKYLETMFPDLVISQSRHTDYKKTYVTVAGSFTDVDKFQDFLNRKSSTFAEATGEERLQKCETAGKMEKKDKEKKEMEPEKCCPICLDNMVPAKMKTLSRCHHSFCKECLRRAFDSKPICPVCGVVYGELKGTQPPNGTMEVSTSPVPLPGHAKCGTIIIRYFIPSGIQGEDHPNPGQRYEGVSRVAFLPDSNEGRRTLELLRRAFDQKLTFTVGRSATTGRDDVVTWNDIHHKTFREGGPTNYGYPDPDYLHRVQEELKAKGIY